MNPVYRFYLVPVSFARWWRLLVRTSWLLCGWLLLFSSVQAGYEEGAKAYAEKNYSTAIGEWSSSDLSNHPQTQFALGVVYMRGVGVSQDFATGIVHYTRAAEAGFASAQFNLGLAYYAGKGVAQSGEQAAKWWQMAAAQGHTVAQYNLGAILWSGDGVEKNQARAIHWFRQARSNGSQDASNFLLTLYAPMYRELNADSLDLARNNAQRTIPLIDEMGMYKLGQQAAAKRDYMQAFGYWQPLAKDGHLNSQYQIARMLEFGLGVDKNLNDAINWYEKAARKGLGRAQYRIALYHLNENPEPNKALGLYWMQSAADNNSEEAVAYIQSQ